MTATTIEEVPMTYAVRALAEDAAKIGYTIDNVRSWGDKSEFTIHAAHLRGPVKVWVRPTGAFDIATMYPITKFKSIKTLRKALRIEWW
jgi:hypothetical protein